MLKLQWWKAAKDGAGRERRPRRCDSVDKERKRQGSQRLGGGSAGSRSVPRFRPRCCSPPTLLLGGSRMFHSAARERRDQSVWISARCQHASHWLILWPGLSGGPDTARLWRDVCLLLGLGDSLRSKDAHAPKDACCCCRTLPRWHPSALSPCSAEHVMSIKVFRAGRFDERLNFNSTAAATCPIAGTMTLLCCYNNNCWHNNIIYK